MKNIFIKDLNRENIEINDYFLVWRKGIFSSKNNTKYMSLELRDKTGTIDGKVWDNVDELSGVFDKNDIVSIKARTRFYQNKPQLTISDIKRIDGTISIEDMREFFPEGETGIERLKDEFFRLIDEVKNPYILSLFSNLTCNQDIISRYFLFPASINVHHMYMGGLLEHSVSIAKIGIDTVGVLGGDRDIIIAGSLLHDIGKIEEMELRGGFRYSDRGRLLGHITLGVTILEGLVREVNGFPPIIADMLAHIIISHHGVEEWGSPKKPMSLEALMIHYIDNLDAKVMGVKEHMKENMEDEKWTEYHRLYESRFYKLPER